MKTAVQRCCPIFPRRTRNWVHESSLSSWFTSNHHDHQDHHHHRQSRSMAKSKRVGDRSKDKRIQDLEIVTENHKILNKVLFLMELLTKEPEMVISVKALNRYRQKINLPKPHKISDFIRKSPELFELYEDRKGVLWCGMTEKAEELVREEEALLRDHEDNAAEIVTRFLMMTVDKRLPLDKIAHFRRDFGLAVDFRTNWVNKYPQHFKVSRDPENGVPCLELVEWNPSWAVTELEKRTWSENGTGEDRPGMLSLPFRLRFPPRHAVRGNDCVKIEEFQRSSYLSPYADARELRAGTLEFNKRVVAVMHELLSFTLEKMLVTTDHLTHFRRELVMPQKLMRLLLKHIGIFYVSERGKRFGVYLTEAYVGRELIEKCPLVLWKEKVLNLVGYRQKKRKKFEGFTDMSDMEELEEEAEEGSFKSDLEDEGLVLGDENGDESEMEVGEICSEFQEQR